MYRHRMAGYYDCHCRCCCPCCGSQGPRHHRRSEDHDDCDCDHDDHEPKEECETGKHRGGHRRGHHAGPHGGHPHPWGMHRPHRGPGPWMGRMMMMPPWSWAPWMAHHGPLAGPHGAGPMPGRPDVRPCGEPKDLPVEALEAKRAYLLAHRALLDQAIKAVEACLGQKPECEPEAQPGCDGAK